MELPPSVSESFYKKTTAFSISKGGGLKTRNASQSSIAAQVKKK